MPGTIRKVFWYDNDEYLFKKLIVNEYGISTLTQRLGVSARVIGMQNATVGYILPATVAMIGGGTYGAILDAPGSSLPADVEIQSNATISNSSGRTTVTISGGSKQGTHRVMPASIDFEYCGPPLMRVFQDYVNDFPFIRKLLMGAFVANQILIEAGVRHNDFTPTNICIDTQRSETLSWQGHTMTFPFRLRVIDFGFAASSDNSEVDPVQIQIGDNKGVKSVHNLTDSLWGKPGYGSPRTTAWFMAGWPNLRRLLYMDFLQLLTFLDGFVLRHKCRNRKLQKLLNRLIDTVIGLEDDSERARHRETVARILEVDLQSTEDATRNLDLSVRMFHKLTKRDFFEVTKGTKRKRET